MNKLIHEETSEGKQQCVKEILELYDHIDPYPLTKNSLGAYQWLQKPYNLALINRPTSLACLLGEFNLEYYVLRPVYPKEMP